MHSFQVTQGHVGATRRSTIDEVLVNLLNIPSISPLRVEFELIRHTLLQIYSRRVRDEAYTVPESLSVFILAGIGRWKLGPRDTHKDLDDASPSWACLPLPSRSCPMV